MQIIIWDEHSRQSSVFLREHIPLTRPSPSPPARLRPSPLPPHSTPRAQGPHFSPSSFPALFVSPAWPGGLPRPLRARRHQGRAAYSRHVPLPPRRGMGTAAAERHQPRRQAEEKRGQAGTTRQESFPTSIRQPRGSRGRENGGGGRRGSPSALLGRDAEGVNALPPRRGRPGTHLESGVLLHLQSH